MSTEKTVRRWVVSVDGGCVVLGIPWPLSAEDRADVLEWLEIVKRQVGRPEKLEASDVNPRKGTR